MSDRLQRGGVPTVSISARLKGMRRVQTCVPEERTLNTKAQLREYGVTPNSVRMFGDDASPDMLEYLDLVGPQRSQKALLPDGVAESNGHALLFFVNESRLASEPTKQSESLTNLRRLLACRGDRAYLARVLPGELKVVPVSLDDRTLEWEAYEPGTTKATTFFSRLALGEYGGQGQPASAHFVFKEMFGLLKQAGDGLANQLDRADVLSLLGRALFFRFLRDRQIVNEEDKQAIAPTASSLLACFDTAQAAAATCQWLDRTFNGDFLPLSDDGSPKFFDNAGRKTNDEVFNQLGAIVRREKQRQLQFDWGDFDFAHVPVGLLSQVYEAFCWKWEPEIAEATSVYYTPRNIAATLVSEAFDKLPNAADCKVLDPACGAGIFLVLAFRRIYAERWAATSRRPDTKAIRDILQNQLTGFDISDAALKLSALSLYLTAIELDPEPIPPEKLRFENLRNDVRAGAKPGNVLFNFRQDEPAGQMVIGSLGTHVGNRFDGQFDLVLSNPPWTRLPETQKDLAKELEKVSQSIVHRRCQPAAKNYHNPDNSPDLPFVWKSTEWCKPGGRIAMALPARTLFKQGTRPRRARETLFRLVEITGIINCSNLRKTNVWPEMDQPFMLAFARNVHPDAGSTVLFVSPHTDKILNALGEVRIDAESATPVEIEATLQESWLWKALSVGTPLDIEVVRKVKSAGGKPFKEYWKSDLHCVSSTGYQVKEKQRPRQDSTFLQILPDLHSAKPEFFEKPAPRFLVDASRLLKFSRATLFRSRKRKRDALAVYRAPLVLVKQAPSMKRQDGRALLSLESVAYNERFFGYSAAGHRDAELLSRYIHLFVHSQLWLHYALLTSPILGVERPRLYKADLDDYPLLPLEGLTDEQRSQILSLSGRLVNEDLSVFAEIDAFFGEIYGLDHLDLEVIGDTLEVRDPNDELGRRASLPPTSAECARFGGRLESVLRPFFKVLGKQPQIAIRKLNDVQLPSDSPFAVLTVGEPEQSLGDLDLIFREGVLPLANETGATRIIVPLQGGLLIGLLRHYRYWTPSRARLLAAEILRNHMQVFEEPG
ncbi:MAG: HsdM family class I SAM-dependent methyltransferase [Pyrinomonadaceae bacterium]